MKLIGEEEINDIALGAAMLGTGGGGDPYIGKLIALQAIRENGPVKVIAPEEVPDDALVVPIGMIGAPTVLVEKPPGKDEAQKVFKRMEECLGEDIYATFPIEIGGVNSLLPIAVAAYLDLPVIDTDGMGRAFPELQMVTFYLDGIPAAPLVMSDEKGNVSILHPIDNKWAEKIARSITIQVGGSATIAQYAMKGKQLKESGIHHSLTFAAGIGKVLKENRQTHDMHPVEAVINYTGAVQLFEGKIQDIDRKTTEGFTKGLTTIEGMNDDEGKILYLHYQNEFLLAEIDAKAMCMTPDLLFLLDRETGIPVTTEALRYGIRCVVLGMKCDQKWRTKKGLETVGPEYFGYSTDYVPLEELHSNGGENE